MNGYKVSDLKHKLKAVHSALASVVGLLDAGFVGYSITALGHASDLMVEARLLQQRQKDHDELRVMLERCETLYKIIGRKAAA